MNSMKKTLLALAACFGAAGVSSAAPTQAQVVAGQATFTQQGNVFSITNTPNTIIDWHSFSVAPGEITRFIQQSSDSAVLNRVVGQDPSRILGALQSNGQVFLINPNGILFGKDARVDVAGLTASTLDLANTDFLAGRRHFKAGARAGALDNQGSIATPSGGKVYLIAPTVENSGVITAADGQVVLAAGRSVQLVDSNNPDLHVVVSAPQDAAINLGQVVAQGGRIGIYGALVRHKGVLDADSAQVGANGKIVLKASDDTLLEAGSVTSARGTGQGGAIHVLGQRVALTGNARVDASGVQGGGTVLVGGDYQGKNPLLPNARQTVLDKDASIRADAVASGQGGKVVLWSDGATRAFGTISTRGGEQGGNGGLVETSGAVLDLKGLKVDAGARRGSAGTWLIDPYDIVITNTDVGFTPILGSGPFTSGEDGSISYLQASVFSGLAETANVLLQARHDVTFSGALTRKLKTTGSMTVEAGNNIVVGTPIDTQGGTLNLKANHAPYASGIGAVQINSTIDTGGGMFTASGVDIAFDAGGKVLNAGAIDLRASKAFLMTAGSELKSGGYIDIMADRVALDGTIGPAAGSTPIVGFRPASASRPIELSENVAADAEVLQLAPSELARISAHSITIGSTAATGGIRVGSGLALTPAVTANLVLETQGALSVEAPVGLQLGSSGNLLLRGASLTVTSDGSLSADQIALRADSMALNGTIGHADLLGGTVSVAPARAGIGIALGGTANATSSAQLMLSEAELGKIVADRVTIGGQDGQFGQVDVSSLSYTSGNVGSPSLAILAGDGDLLIGGNLVTDRKLTLQGRRIASGAAYYAKAPALVLAASESIGSANLPLQTRTFYLRASNDYAGGVGVINIENNLGAPDALNLESVVQAGSGNQGAISILNHGAMTLLAGQLVSTGGSVSLATRSPLTIAGAVTTGSGAVTLEAGNGGVLTVAPSGSVASGGGISATGGSIVNNGSLATSSGSVTTVGPLSGSGTITAPGSNPGPTAPTLTECVSNPALSGCAAVLPTLEACVLNPALAGCSVRLPTLAVCSVAPSTPGCSAVLPTLAVCSAAPSTPGCSAVLPPLATCETAPGTPGCGAVLPTLAQCIATPGAPGCAAVLPTLAQCSLTPGAPGCQVVLPTLASCIATPATAGCQAVLPALQTCVATPTTLGCQSVLPALSQCVATPSRVGCAAVLPGLSACTSAPALEGCQAVLPTLAQCAATPAAPGCAVVLPSLSVCVANPSLAGCTVVLPGLASCVASPSLPGCSAVLPALSACVSAPATAGCGVVLPTLAQCVDSPTLQGCNVVLPPVNACVANPAAPGCVVVAPPATPPAGSPLQEAADTAINLINQTGQQAAFGNGPAGLPGAPGSPIGQGLAGAADGNQANAGGSGNTSGEAAKEAINSAAADGINQGGKSAKLVKTYCN